MKEELAASLTERLYADMPGLGEKYGEIGRVRCHEDMRFTVEHLAPAVALSDSSLFSGYVEWLDGLLRARNVDTVEVVRTLELLEALVVEALPEDEAAAALPSVRAGLVVIRPAE
jgi:hypothetical protein